MVKLITVFMHMIRMPAHSQMGAIASWLLDVIGFDAKDTDTHEYGITMRMHIASICTDFCSSKSHYTAMEAAAAMEGVNELRNSYSKIPSCSFCVHLYALHVWQLSLLHRRRGRCSSSEARDAFKYLYATYVARSTVGMWHFVYQHMGRNSYKMAKSNDENWR